MFKVLGGWYLFVLRNNKVMVLERGWVRYFKILIDVFFCRCGYWGFFFCFNLKDKYV